MANPAEEGKTMKNLAEEENTNIIKPTNLDAILKCMARSNPSILSRQDEIKEKLRRLSSSHRPDHPPYASMIEKAITTLNEKEGSSEAAISKFLEENYQGLPFAHSNFLSHHLWALTEKTVIVYTRKNCYKMKAEVTSSCSNLKHGKKPLKKKRGRPRKVKEGLCWEQQTVATEVGNPIHIEEDNMIERPQSEERHKSQEQYTDTSGKRKKEFTDMEIYVRKMQTKVIEKEVLVERQPVEGGEDDDLNQADESSAHKKTPELCEENHDLRKGLEVTKDQIHVEESQIQPQVVDHQTEVIENEESLIQTDMIKLSAENCQAHVKWIIKRGRTARKLSKKKVMKKNKVGKGRKQQKSIAGLDNPAHSEHENAVLRYQPEEFKDEKSIDVLFEGTDQKNEANGVQPARDGHDDKVEEENQSCEQLTEVDLEQTQLQDMEIEVIDEQHHVFGQLADDRNEADRCLAHNEQTVVSKLIDDQKEKKELESIENDKETEELQGKVLEKERQRPLHKLIEDEIAVKDVQMPNDQEILMAGKKTEVLEVRNEAEKEHELTEKGSEDQVDNEEIEVQNENISEHVQLQDMEIVVEDGVAEKESDQRAEDEGIEEHNANVAEHGQSQKIQNAVVRDVDRRQKQQNEVTEKESDQHNADVAEHVQSQEMQTVVVENIDRRQKQQNEVTEEHKKLQEQQKKVYLRIQDLSDAAMKLFTEKKQDHVSTSNSTLCPETGFHSESLLLSTDDCRELQFKTNNIQEQLNEFLISMINFNVRVNNSLQSMVEEANASKEHRVRECTHSNSTEVEIFTLRELCEKHGKQAKACRESDVCVSPSLEQARQNTDIEEEATDQKNENDLKNQEILASERSLRTKQKRQTKKQKTSDEMQSNGVSNKRQRQSSHIAAAKPVLSRPLASFKSRQKMEGKPFWCEVSRDQGPSSVHDLSILPENQQEEAQDGSGHVMITRDRRRPFKPKVAVNKKKQGNKERPSPSKSDLKNTKERLEQQKLQQRSTKRKRGSDTEKDVLSPPRKYTKSGKYKKSIIPTSPIAVLALSVPKQDKEEQVKSPQQDKEEQVKSPQQDKEEQVKSPQQDKEQVKSPPCRGRILKF